MIETQLSDRRKQVIEGFERQIGWCNSLGSPFTARVLSAVAADIAADGDMARMIGDWPGDPDADALPLRVAGAFHALALSGVAPDLAAVYPPHAADGLEPVLRAAVQAHEGLVRVFLSSPPQTNEVGRSGVLLGGFLEVAKRTGLAMRLLEIGGSAGLNLIWDRYRYRIGDGVWGDPASPVLLQPAWEGGMPPLECRVSILSRAGCDIAPIDLEDAEQRLRLRAYVWADQRDRLARMEQAIGVAREAGHRVEKADAAAWVAGKLAEEQPGCVSVLYHSIMWQYMPPATQAAILDCLQRAGARATSDAPLAWLRFEPLVVGAKAELRLTLWPGGDERVLATAQAHGASVTWA